MSAPICETPQEDSKRSGQTPDTHNTHDTHNADDTHDTHDTHDAHGTHDTHDAHDTHVAHDTHNTGDTDVTCNTDNTHDTDYTHGTAMSVRQTGTPTWPSGECLHSVCVCLSMMVLFKYRCGLIMGKRA